MHHQIVGFSVTTRMRKGAPLHGAIGAGKTATPAASSQRPNELSARVPAIEKSKTRNALAISNAAATAADGRRVGSNLSPLPLTVRGPRPITLLRRNCASPENWPTSALGQKRTFRNVRLMAAFPPKADIGTRSRNVRFVPKADIGAGSGNVRFTPKSRHRAPGLPFILNEPSPDL